MKKIAFLSHLDLNLYLFRLPLMKELVKKEYKVYAICPRGEVFDKFKEEGIEAIDYKIERSSLNPFKEIKTIKNIYKTIKQLNLDILHNFTAKPNIYGSIAGSFANVPTIINTVTGLGSFYIRDDFKSKVVRNYMEFFYKLANKKVNNVIFQNSDDLNYFVNKNLVSKEKAILIKGSGIDTKKFDIKNVDIEKKKKELGINNKIVVLMVARAIWDKGIREYYEMAKSLSKKYKNVVFLYVGNTDDGNISSASKKFLNSSYVKWLGFRRDILELTAISDIYVLPSYYREGVPRTLLEAASMAKPIVTTNTVGCREVVDNGVNGFLVPIKDSKSLADKIEILIKNKDLREEMSKKSREKAVKEFDIEKIVNEYMRIYNG